MCVFVRVCVRVYMYIHTHLNIQFHFLLVHSFALVLNTHTPRISERTRQFEDRDGHTLT